MKKKKRKERKKKRKTEEKKKKKEEDEEEKKKNKKKGKIQENMGRRSRKRSSNIGSEKLESVGRILFDRPEPTVGCSANGRIRR